MENNIEIKIVIKPTEDKGFAMFIIEPKDKIMFISRRRKYI